MRHLSHVWIATAYVEIYRGRPLLIQLFIIYYGLPNIRIALSPLTAANIGLRMPCPRSILARRIERRMRGGK